MFGRIVNPVAAHYRLRSTLGLIALGYRLDLSHPRSIHIQAPRRLRIPAPHFHKRGSRVSSGQPARARLSPSSLRADTRICRPSASPSPLGPDAQSRKHTNVSAAALPDPVAFRSLQLHFRTASGPSSSARGLASSAHGITRSPS
ncbi:hypothetical protein BD309DRAFT_206802 [Dichomitus squalens]|uniref:Uncharacterized protein n=1 Tax=Dichomitus squalens TaxID=114155 RepID=A0A4Q9NLC0_9APHY|nr:hypothetical protein BD309DRAFT_206802 [Dichomitus squalens]TBU52960.1 hypothetical protein BD310DRAFT_185981 [Dichomitus squalens]